MHEPTTPAGLPRNREADAWRTAATVWERNALSCLVFAVGMVAVWAVTKQERDAARAQVSAAEQRAGRAEAALDGNGCRSLAEVGRVRREVRHEMCARIEGRIQWVPLFGGQP